MDLCACVSENHRDDGKGPGWEEIDRLSYTRRYISSRGGFSQRLGDVAITNGPVCMCERVA